MAKFARNANGCMCGWMNIAFLIFLTTWLIIADGGSTRRAILPTLFSSQSGVTQAVKPGLKQRVDASQRMRSMVDGAEGSAADDETGVSVEVPEFIEAETVSSTSTPVTTDTQCNLGLTGRGAISYIEKKWVARGDTSVQYMHMPTIAQAAKRAEGANDQAIYYSYTDSAGDISTWSSPRKLPIPSGKRTGPQWSPVPLRPYFSGLPVDRHNMPVKQQATLAFGVMRRSVAILALRKAKVLSLRYAQMVQLRLPQLAILISAEVVGEAVPGGDLLVIKTNNLK
eukprot:gene2917-3730_t